MKFIKLLLLNAFALSGAFSFCGGELASFKNNAPSLQFLAAKKIDIPQCKRPLPSDLVRYVHHIQSRTSGPLKEEILDAINKDYIKPGEAFVVALRQRDASCVESIISRLASTTPEQQQIKTACIKIAQLLLSPKERVADIERMINPSRYRADASYVFEPIEPSGLSRKFLNVLQFKSDQNPTNDQVELMNSANQLEQSIRGLNHPAGVEDNPFFELAIKTAVTETRAYETLPLHPRLKYILISFDLIRHLMPLFREKEDFKRIYFNTIFNTFIDYISFMRVNGGHNNPDKAIERKRFFARKMTDEMKERTFNKQWLDFYTRRGERKLVELIYEINPKVTGTCSRWDHKLRASIPYTIKKILFKGGHYLTIALLLYSSKKTFESGMAMSKLQMNLKASSLWERFKDVPYGNAFSFITKKIAELKPSSTEIIDTLKKNLPLAKSSDNAWKKSNSLLACGILVKIITHHFGK